MLPCALLPKWTTVSPTHGCDRWRPDTPEAMARREAQAGIDQAVAAADRKVEGWSDLALEFIRLFCVQNKGKRCIGHDIVQASIAKGVIQPENAKAWGGPIQRAVRAGLLKRATHEGVPLTAPDPNRHTNPVPLWEVA